MFTFKKLALVGAACLAAFAMSCSDDKDDTTPFNGNPDRWTVPFTVTFTSPTFTFTGIIEAESGDHIEAASITVDGGQPTSLIGITFPTDKVDLSKGSYSIDASLCPAGQTKSFTFVAGIQFTTEEPIGATQVVTITCPDLSGANAALIKKDITLSYNGKSYADIDGQTALYSSAEVCAAANPANNTANCATNAAKIDLIAYKGTSAANKIYTPTGASLTNGNGAVSLYPLQDAAAAVLNNATKVSDIASLISNIDDITGDDDENAVDELPATQKAFLVFTSEGEYVAVVWKADGPKTGATGNAALTVTIGTVSQP